MIPGAAAAAIRARRPDIIINAAAYTAVDRAESDAQTAFRINAQAVGEIAEAARETGARLVHLSTDYVFPGDGEAPLGENAPVAPVNVYGASKLDGEVLALKAAPGAIILRTSWVFSPYGSNFLKTMLRLSETRTALDIVADQWGGPTSAAAIAEACLAIARAETPAAGVFHFQGAPAATWAGFAEEIFRVAGVSVNVRKIDTDAYPTAARRPKFTVLNCSKILAAYGLSQPDWRADIASAISRLTSRP